MLLEKTNEIKWLTKGIKNNFIKIGSILKEIRDKEIYRENHDTFTVYLESSEFNFSRQHAYKFIQVFDKFGDVAQCDTIPLNKLLKIAHVEDKEVRESLLNNAIEEKTQQAKPNVLDFQRKIHRTTVRTDSDIETPIDSRKDKTKRQLINYLDELPAFKAIRNDMRIRKEKLLEISSEFEDQEIKKLREIIKEEEIITFIYK